MKTCLRSLLPALALLLSASSLDAQARRPEELRYPALPPFAIAQPERVELPNGLVVLLLEDHELPLVHATALVRAGSSADPAEKVGLTQVGAEVMRSGGAGERSADELDDFLEDRAAILELAPSASSVRAEMDVPAESFAEVLAAFADVLRRPQMPADRLDLAKSRLASSLARQNDNPFGVVQRELNKVVFGDASPWARTPTYATVESLNRDDLVAWHQRSFAPNRMVLGLVGDFDAKQATALVRQAFGDWPRAASARDPAPPVGSGPKPGVYAVEKPDLNQSYVAMGYLGIRRDDPDYFPLEVMNQLYGGAFSSRLFSTVRSKKGLAYSVFGAVSSAYDRPGLTIVSLQTKAETTGAGIEALLEETRGMISSPPTPEEVSRAKDSILNAFIFNSDSRQKTLSQQLTDAFGYPADWLSRYRAGVEAVTVDQVRAVAKKHLRAAELAIVVVGPKEGLDRPLADFGQVTVRDITIPEAPRPGG